MSDPLVVYRQLWEPKPDDPRPIVVFRLWEIAPGPRLRSSFDGEFWEPGWTRARCGLRHRAPSLRCHCGLFGYLDLRDTKPIGRGVRVLGAALAAGTVRVHERGVRAEYMRPVAFELPPVVTVEIPRRLPLDLVWQSDVEEARRRRAEETQRATPIVLELGRVYGCSVFDNDEDLLDYLRRYQSARGCDQ